MNTEYIITTAIAVLALLVSCYSAWYCRKNFKMSRYEFDKRRREEKQAVLKAEAVYSSNGRYAIIITNVGKSEARNIVCDFPKDEFKNLTIMGDKTFPLLDSEKSFSINAFACEGDNEHPTFNITWDDDYSKSNSKKLTISL